VCGRSRIELAVHHREEGALRVAQHGEAPAGPVCAPSSPARAIAASASSTPKYRFHAGCPPGGIGIMPPLDLPSVAIDQYRPSAPAIGSIVQPKSSR
jgi:hypothetical protein